MLNAIILTSKTWLVWEDPLVNWQRTFYSQWVFHQSQQDDVGYHLRDISHPHHVSYLPHQHHNNDDPHVGHWIILGGWLVGFGWKRIFYCWIIGRGLVGWRKVGVRLDGGG